jgi:hypothetical protein
VGILVVQGFTLRPVLRLLKLDPDETVEREIRTGRADLVRQRWRAWARKIGTPAGRSTAYLPNSPGISMVLADLRRKQVKLRIISALPLTMLLVKAWTS